MPMAVKPKMTIRIEPQSGPQTEFNKCPADIALYGGAAGGGKSFGLLIDPLRHYENSKFGAVIFRKTAVQVRNKGGLWDESMLLYPLLDGQPRAHTLEWRFPSRMSIGFSHIEYEKDLLNFQGTQIPWIGFDELTHFTESQFFYMLSRNRSLSGVKPRIRATCNPDPDSWVKKFIIWWLDENGTYPDPKKAGVLRWFIRLNDSMVWADSAEEIFDRYGRGPEIHPKSVTFIPSKLEDNKILMKQNPEYLGNLLAMNRVDRLRLKDGNWSVRASAGTIFQREWFQVIDAVPSGWIQQVRYWDRAATKPNEGNKDPDWTRGLKLFKYPNGSFVVVDLKSIRDTPGQVESLIKNTASQDTRQCRIVGEQDPGSAGVADAKNFVTMLMGYNVQTTKPTKDKVTRAKPVSAQSEVGNIRILRAPWNDEFFTELENFPDGAHDDIVDVLSGAFNELAGGLSICDVL